MDQNHIKRTHVLQQDQRDCGVACLLALIRYYGGDNTFEDIRQLCGADISGTSILGLKEAANQLNLISEGCQSDINGLIEDKYPLILHVELSTGLQHYIIWYGEIETEKKSQNRIFLIGDPGIGIQELSEFELTKIWKSRICLTVSPKDDFIKVQEKNKNKRKWFTEIIREDIPIISISIIVSILVGALGLSMAVYSQQLIDEILPSKNINKTIISTILVIIILFSKIGLTALRQFLLLRQNKEFGARLNSEFYKKLLYLPNIFFDSRKSGDFVARLNDTCRIKNIVSVLVGNLLVDILISISSIGLLLYYNWVIGLICIAIIPIQFFLIYIRNTDVVTAQKNAMAAYSASESNYINTIQGISDIKNRNKQHFFSNLNEILYGNFQEAVYRSGIIQIKLSNISGLISVTLIAIILSLTIYNVYLGSLLIGEMTAILAIVSTLLPAVNNLALISIPINEAKVAFDRMYEYSNINQVTSIVECPKIDFSQIALTNISFRFPGKAKILRNISLYLKKGEVISIVSESGAGKSLLCQIIQKFYEPESGDIKINESTPLSSIPDNHWREIVSVVPQNIHLFNGTVIDNICLSNSSQEIQGALNLMSTYGFGPFFEGLPQGLMTDIGEGGIALSGGQKQMIGLARALVTNPKLLILDESTASLDRTNERFVLDLLEKIKENMGIIFITHRLHTLKNTCDRIYIMENGDIVESGDHNKLMKSLNIYSDYWFSWQNTSNISVLA